MVRNDIRLADAMRSTAHRRVEFREREEG